MSAAMAPPRARASLAERGPYNVYVSPPPIPVHPAPFPQHIRAPIPTDHCGTSPCASTSTTISASTPPRIKRRGTRTNERRQEAPESTTVSERSDMPTGPGTSVATGIDASTTIDSAASDTSTPSPSIPDSPSSSPDPATAFPIDSPATPTPSPTPVSDPISSSPTPDPITPSPTPDPSTLSPAPDPTTLSLTPIPITLSSTPSSLSISLSPSQPSPTLSSTGIDSDPSSTLSSAPSPTSSAPTSPSPTPTTPPPSSTNPQPTSSSAELSSSPSPRSNAPPTPSPSSTSSSLDPSSDPPSSSSLPSSSSPPASSLSTTTPELSSSTPTPTPTPTTSDPIDDPPSTTTTTSPTPPPTHTPPHFKSTRTTTEFFTTTLPNGSASTSVRVLTSGVLSTNLADNENSFARNTGAIIAVALAAAAALIIGTLLAFFLCRRYRARSPLLRAGSGSGSDRGLTNAQERSRSPLDDDGDEQEVDFGFREQGGVGGGGGGGGTQERYAGLVAALHPLPPSVEGSAESGGVGGGGGNGGLGQRRSSFLQGAGGVYMPGFAQAAESMALANGGVGVGAPVFPPAAAAAAGGGPGMLRRGSGGSASDWYAGREFGVAASISPSSHGHSTVSGHGLSTGNGNLNGYAYEMSTGRSAVSLSSGGHYGTFGSGSSASGHALLHTSERGKAPPTSYTREKEAGTRVRGFLGRLRAGRAGSAVMEVGGGGRLGSKESLGAYGYKGRSPSSLLNPPPPPQRPLMMGALTDWSYSGPSFDPPGLALAVQPPTPTLYRGGVDNPYEEMGLGGGGLYVGVEGSHTGVDQSHAGLEQTYTGLEQPHPNHLRPPAHQGLEPPSRISRDASTQSGEYAWTDDSHAPPEGLLRPGLGMFALGRGEQASVASLGDHVDYSRPIGGVVNNRMRSTLTFETHDTTETNTMRSMNMDE